MEEVQKFVGLFSKEGKSGLPSLSDIPFKFGGVGGGSGSGGGGGGIGVSTSMSSIDQSRVLVPRPPRNMVSIMTCSKLCAFFFAAGIVVGFTLKRRVRRWASKLLNKLKD